MRQKNGSEQGVREARLHSLPLGSSMFHERMLAICLQSDTPPSPASAPAHPADDLQTRTSPSGCWRVGHELAGLADA